MFKTFKKLQAYTEGKRAFLPASMIMSGISTLTGMLPLIFIWFIARELLAPDIETPAKTVTTYAWWAVGTAVASVILYFFALHLSHIAAFRVEINIRRNTMKKIVLMPLGFFDNNTSGRIRKIIDENASITHTFIAHQLPDLIGSIITPIVIIILLFVFEWQLGIACLIPFAVTVFIMGIMQQQGKKLMYSYMNSLEDMNNEAVEYVRGIPVVKTFQQTIFSFKSFHNTIMKYKDMVGFYAKIWRRPMSIYTTLVNSSYIFLIPAAILIIANGGNYVNTIVNLFFFLLITPRFSSSIMRSMYISEAMDKAGEAIERIENLVKTEPLPEPVIPGTIAGHDICFSKVSFSYPGTNKKAVDNVSFKIKKGDTVALVGFSGGGKTTIAKLLPRFYDVDEGEITIGGVNIKDIGKSKLMDSISFVFQNTHLFKTTLLENIKYGNPDASIEEVEHAVDVAQCRSFIDKLPGGLNTKIGVEGTYLSGGEQQRIALARVILKNAPIVVLDEATSFTDPENEHIIRKALKKLVEGKTVLMIAHRLTSVIDAEKILVINDGQVAEQGKHHELIDRKGLYNKMWNEYKQSIKWTIGKKEVQNV